MAEYGVLKESVVDLLFMESEELMVTEGATLDINKKFKDLTAQYRLGMKNLKAAVSEKY